MAQQQIVKSKKNIQHVFCLGVCYVFLVFFSTVVKLFEGYKTTDMDSQVMKKTLINTKV
jgi:hypothetical protein